jgi:hypothetical protein
MTGAIACAAMDQGGRGRHRHNGKIQFSPILGFDTRAVADAFSRAVLSALADFAPDVLTEEGAA